MLSTQLGKQAKKDVACEAGVAGEEVVLLTDIQEDGEKSSVADGALHALGAPGTIEESAVEMSDAVSPCLVHDSGDSDETTP